MAVPVITSVAPATGPSSGGDIVRLVGSGFATWVSVVFGDTPGEVVSVREELGESVADVRTPSHTGGLVDITLTNLDATFQPVSGETTTVASAYRYVRSEIAREADLTRLIRTLIRELKKQVIDSVSTSVSVDYDDSTGDGLRVIAMATLPSVVLTGPTLRADRFYSTNVLQENVVAGLSGPEIVRLRPSYTVDLAFQITAASERTAELFNLMAAVARFLNRNRWIEMLRDPSNPGLGTCRWEMDAEGDFQTQLSGKDDVRGFTCGLVIRGFDVDEGLPIDLGKAVAETDLETTSVPGP
jgi:hypothetical protein